MKRIFNLRHSITNSREILPSSVVCATIIFLVSPVAFREAYCQTIDHRTLAKTRTIIYGPGSEIPTSCSSADSLLSISNINTLVMPKIDNSILINRDISNSTKINDGTPLYQVAEPIFVDIDPSVKGNWEELANGDSLWRLRIVSKSAYSLAIAFEKYFMPPGGRLFVFSPDCEKTMGPFTDINNHKHGQLWLPAFPGDDIVLEVKVPSPYRNSLRLKIGEVNHSYREDMYSLDKGEPVIYTPNSPSCNGNYPSGCPGQIRCNVDIECLNDDPWDSMADYMPQGVDWGKPIRSVGQLDIGNGLCNCTGTLINNTALDGEMYFITASHCFRICESERGLSMNDGLASVKIYWNYYNSECRDYTVTSGTEKGNGSVSHVTVGGATSVYEKNYNENVLDFILIKLEEYADEDYDVYFAGWDRIKEATTAAVAIHHPKAQEKRISLDNDGSYSSSGQIVNYGYDYGTIQNGSSGSPMFDEAGRVVGAALSTASEIDQCSGDSYWPLHGHYSGVFALWNDIKQWIDPMSKGPNWIYGQEDCVLRYEDVCIDEGSYAACTIVAKESDVVGVSVTFAADDYVHLREGFHVNSANGAHFRAYIQ